MQQQLEAISTMSKQEVTMATSSYCHQNISTNLRPQITTKLRIRRRKMRNKRMSKDRPFSSLQEIREKTTLKLSSNRSWWKSPKQTKRRERMNSIVC